MPRQASLRLALLFAFLGSAAAVRGQEPAPAPIRAPALTDGVELVYAWRYHPGDDPRWAEPAADDAGWEPVVPLLPAAGLPRGGWPGTGWFRRHLRVEPAVWGTPLTMRVETSGPIAVFLDGEPLLDVGARTSGASLVMTFSRRTDHVLAVRYSAQADGRNVESRGFRLSIARVDSVPAQLARARRGMAVLAAFTALPVFLALLHLALFWANPKARENLFYALSMIAFAGIVACDLRLSQATSPLWRSLAPRLSTPFVIATIFSILLTYYAVRTRSFPRSWMAFAGLGAALAVAAFLRPGPLADWCWYGYFAVMVVEVFRVEASGRTVAREGVRILLYGLLVLNAVIIVQIAVNLGLLPPISGVSGVYVLGILAFAVSMSLFLARSFARASRMEAENARKSAEIEAARALQLSMLPAELPEVEGLEVAAMMATASEVGGDFYDFRVAPDGSLVVAFGDATGHGVAAGIMVTAVKSFFSVQRGGEGLPEMLAECDRLLRGLNVKPLHMCLTVARVTPHSVAACAAAMPPVLIHRAATGEVEELGAGGLPVGAKLAGSWPERSAVLAPGDTLLFASDGFAELLDPADNALGFEAAVAAFRAAAGAPVRELIGELFARVTDWRDGREQADDITFVAVRTAGASARRPAT
jgi:serine phosphatase RsbU (regulator of sigma subunit)